MPLVINSNISSLNSQRQLVKSGMEMDQAMERLSSGKRINTAADDAAGLAISNRQTSQIRGLDRAVANANDGVSLIQTAEGALDESTNILQRMRELSIQSANGIYSNEDRATLDAEVQQLVAELDRIAETTSFNGQNILDGSLGEISLQVGSEANQTIDFGIEAFDADTLGMGSQSVDLAGGANSLVASTTSIDHNDILINGQSIVGVGENWTGGTDDIDELIDSINENVLGVTASLNTSVTAETAGDGVLAAGQELTVTVGKLDGTTAAITITDTENLGELVDKLNAEGGGLIAASVNDNGKLTINAADASSVTFTDVAGASGTLNDTQGQISLKADNNDPISVARGANGTLADLEQFGFRENDVAGEIEGDAVDGNALAIGDLTINGVAVGASDSGGLTDKIKAINEVSSETGVTATAFTSTELDFGSVDLTSLVGGDIGINGVDVTISAGGASTTLQTIADEVNAETDATGVAASVLGDRLVLEGDVASIIFGDDAAANAIEGVLTDGTNVVQFGGADIEGDGTDVAAGGIRLESENGSPIQVEHAPNGTAAEKTASEAKTGLLDSNAGGGGAFGSAVSSISIGTQKGAQDAIEVIDNALDTINAQRSDLGAINNRLDFTVSNLMNISENTSAARSQIQDADFAAETANLSRAQVLQQASQAMLAQANAAPQQVLSLLR